MNKLAKFSSVVLALCMTAGTIPALAACGDDKPQEEKVEFHYEAEKLSAMEDSAHDYNANLFYVNSLEFGVADPSVIYITEGEEQGWFYAYGTSDEINGHGYQAWRSKDLSHWETTGLALSPDFSVAWATDNYWAPEVVYDKKDKTYYMVYNAWNQNENLGPECRLCLSVASSKSPKGPFTTPRRENADMKQIGPDQPVIDLHESNTAIPQKYRDMGFDCALDASPFIDPATGDKYLYFGWYDIVGSGDRDGTHLFGMKMKDWFTPDYTTLTELTAPGYSSLERYHNPDTHTPDLEEVEGHINEGPFMYYHDGTYYLTYSINGYTDETYRVMQATSDDPLGVFKKIPEEDGGTVIASSPDWTHIKSAGHHSFVEVGDELFIAYHTFRNRQDISNGRALAVDRVVWAENEAGDTVMHTNGPSWSLQPLPEAISGYKNIAPSATVTVNGKNADGDDNLALLTDGLLKYRDLSLGDECTFTAKTNEIVLKWANPVTARGFLIYNSWDYETTFSAVRSVEMDYLRSNGDTATAVIENLGFDWDWCFEDESGLIRPGGAAIAEFAELPIKEMRIVIDMPAGAEEFAVGELVVLGKDVACKGVDSFEEYTYENATYGSPHIERNSVTFGAVEVDGKPSSYIKTTDGFNVDNDKGTADSYILQTGARDQFAFFKDIFSTEFYAKATLTVTADRGYANDQYPKFGFAIRCEDKDELGNDIHNTIIYYVDAANNYTLGRVGCAQRNMSDTDWLWGQDETLKDVPGMQYKNGNTVTLEVIRKGAAFYFICNGTLVIEKNDFNVFDEDLKAAIGFFSFNTPMKITNYSATQDSAEVAKKLQEFGK